MALSIPLSPATTPTTTPPAYRPFTPTEGSYEAVCAAAAVQYELEAMLAALPTAASPLALLEQRLDAAREALHAASDAYLAPLASFPC